MTASRSFSPAVRPPSDESIAVAAALLRAGEVVAFPTETVYGLGADATNPEAVARIFAIKGRPLDNPLIVHVDSAEAAAAAAEWSPEAQRLAEAFWPGPLALVLRRRPDGPVCPEVSAGLPTVAVRSPAHPVALRLLRAAGLPLAAPSANRSGRPSPTEAAHVAAELGRQAQLILDGGPCEVGLESTVVDLSGAEPTLLRPGAVGPEAIASLLGRSVRLGPGASGERVDSDAPVLSPGMKYTHYAPAVPLHLVEAGPGAADRLRDEARRLLDQGFRVGLLHLDEADGLPEGDGRLRFFRMGERGDPAGVARRLFALIRAAEQDGAEVILVEGMRADGLGLAVMNRLRRAASRVIV